MSNDQDILSIVVPAWKPDYLYDALASIAAQTDDRFSVIVFDDAGPGQVRDIAGEFAKFDFVRFDDNLGTRDLVGHWNRCLDYVTTDWVWMFSDDDVMSRNCVAEFYNGLAANPEAVLFQFSVTQVARDLKPITRSRAAGHQTASDFLRARLSGAQISCVPDHVFKWSELKRKTRGFVRFPLAWNSDDATWLLLAKEKGIVGLEHGEVLWRQSDLNISASSANSWQKLDADVGYLAWLREMEFPVPYFRSLRWLSARIAYVYELEGKKALATRLPRGLWPALGLAKLYPLLRMAKKWLEELRSR